MSLRWWRALTPCASGCDATRSISAKLASTSGNGSASKIVNRPGWRSAASNIASFAAAATRRAVAIEPNVAVGGGSEITEMSIPQSSISAMRRSSAISGASGCRAMEYMPA